MLYFVFKGNSSCLYTICFAISFIYSTFNYFSIIFASSCTETFMFNSLPHSMIHPQPPQTASHYPGFHCLVPCAQREIWPALHHFPDASLVAHFWVRLWLEVMGVGLGEVVCQLEGNTLPLLHPPILKETITAHWLIKVFANKFLLLVSKFMKKTSYQLTIKIWPVHKTLCRNGNFISP